MRPTRGFIIASLLTPGRPLCVWRCGRRYRKSECYQPSDFRMGAYINVLNRDFLIHDADTFTKSW